MTADREALVDAFLGSLRPLLLACLADGCAPLAPDRDDRTLRVKDGDGPAPTFDRQTRPCQRVKAGWRYYRRSRIGQFRSTETR
jgi:hypothetical protein